MGDLAGSPYSLNRGISDVMNEKCLNSTESFSAKREPGIRLVRYGLLLLALLLPATTLPNLESVSPFAVESEAACEDVTECSSFTAGHRQRKRRARPTHGRSAYAAHAARPFSARSRPAHCFDGHRIRNGLLAPMRC